MKSFFSWFHKKSINYRCNFCKSNALIEHFTEQCWREKAVESPGTGLSIPLCPLWVLWLLVQSLSILLCKMYLTTAWEITSDRGRTHNLQTVDTLKCLNMNHRMSGLRPTERENKSVSYQSRTGSENVQFGLPADLRVPPWMLWTSNYKEVVCPCVIFQGWNSILLLVPEFTACRV